MTASEQSAEIEALAQLLAKHRDDMETGDYGEVLWSGCTCGDEHTYDWHDRHLASVILGHLRATPPGATP